MIWFLIILNINGGAATQVYFDSEMLCEAAAVEVEELPYTVATCVYGGTE